jgi:Zn-dependent protease with chaperone function
MIEANPDSLNQEQDPEETDTLHRVQNRPGSTGTASRRYRRIPLAVAMSLMLLLAGCAAGTSQRTGPGEPAAARQPAPGARQIDARQAERLRREMPPLIQNMNHPLPLNKVRVTLLEDPQINAANAGGGDFYVTTGLLEKANDEQLRGVLAHEVAHADLGHVAKAQALGTGMNIGIIILDQIIPGSGYITPLVADLGVMKPFSRKEEYEADAHGVEILNRAGYNGKQVMGNTLTWLLQSSGSSGGFFATHPGTDDRIQRIHALP